MEKLAIAIVAAVACGCTFTGRNGTVHHVVLGIGIVSVNKTNVAAQVVKTTALGVAASPGQFMVGYGSGMTTYVETNANVIIEVSDKIGGPVTVISR